MGGSGRVSPDVMDEGTVSRASAPGDNRLRLKPVQHTHRRKYTPDDQQHDTAPINRTIHCNSARAPEILARSPAPIFLNDHTPLERNSSPRSGRKAFSLIRLLSTAVGPIFIAFCAPN